MTGFEGWYFKHQKAGNTLCIIAGRARGEAFIQVITNGASYYAQYPRLIKDGFVIRVGGSVFSAEGAQLDVRADGLSLSGRIGYGALSPLRSDIMGPLRFVPMQCRHSVISMWHRLNGGVTLNGAYMDFDGGVGYIEGDSGSGFPRSYTWLHFCSADRRVSVMAAVADIPVMPFPGAYFTGCMCAVWLDGEEHRLATYKGAKTTHAGRGVIELKQGPYAFSAHIDGGDGRALRAPRSGRMTREIIENASCDARVRLYKDGGILLDETTSSASYEYAGD